MLFVFLGLWAIGGILLLSDGRSPATRWLSGVAFCGGCGALAALMGDYVMPYAVSRNAGEAGLRLLTIVQNSLSVTQYYGLPYCFVLFAVHYRTPALLRGREQALAVLLLLPIGATLLSVTPVYPIPYRIALLWVLPYLAFGTYLVLTRREQSLSLRRNHFYTTLAVLPAVLLCSVMNYILPSLGYAEMWRYNTWFILIAVILFLIAILNFGFLGIRVLIETRKLDYTIRAITSGTAILNHSIKNDVGKMKLFGDKIRAYAEETGQEELAEDIRVILDSSRHIQEMINRVQDQTQDLLLRKGLHRPAELLDLLLEQLAPRLNGVTVIRRYEEDAEIECDREQVLEALNNLLTNALEAMPSEESWRSGCRETRSRCASR
ncbi:ATP-binding protein [Paenibacillus sp. CC-CFT747]|nr:ATP-binding protein [Paenibacillus sp. CC-CFT747]